MQHTSLSYSSYHAVKFRNGDLWSLLPRIAIDDNGHSALYGPQTAFHSQVADLIKNDRLNRLNAVVNEVVEERAQRFLGSELEVSTLYQFQKMVRYRSRPLQHPNSQ